MSTSTLEPGDPAVSPGQSGPSTPSGPPTPPGTSGPSGPSPRSVWLVLGIAVTVVSIVAVSLHVVSWLTERVTEQHHTYAAETLSRVEIDSSNGDVQVVHGTVGQVTVDRRVHSSYAHPRLTERIDGDTLLISSRCGLWLGGLSCSTDYRVQVPAGLSVQVRSSSGDVDVRDVTGNVRLDSSSGDVTVSHVDGDLDISLSSGDVKVDDVHGRVTSRASSGDLTMTGLRSSGVDLTSSSGDIRLEFAEAPSSVFVKASSGDVDVAMPGHDAYRVNVDTSSGDRRVDVVQDPSASRSITADVSSGDVRIRYLGD